jgi:predicted MFS family arabinose efflux permease
LTRDREFLKLWSGETISLVGSQFSGIAIPILAVNTLGVTAFQLGLLNALTLLPFPLFGLFVGVWADRHRKRPTMIAADVGRMFFLGLIPLSAYFFTVGLPLLFVVVFAVGTLQTFFDISYQSYLPYLVQRDQLIEGNSRLETSRSVATVVGPSLAGFAVGVVGAPSAILGDVCGYLGSASFLSQINRPEAAPPKRETHVLHDIKEGLEVIVRNRNLGSIALCTGTFNLFQNAFAVVVALLLLRTFGFSDAEFGLVFGIGGLGAVVSAITSLRLIKRLGVGISIIFGILISGFPFLSFYFVGASTAFIAASLAFFLSSFGGVLYNVAQVSYRQALVPLELQGRMNASMRVLVWGPIPVGAILGGVLGAAIGVRETLLLTAAATSLAFLWVMLSPVRSVKSIPQREAYGTGT